MYSLFYGKCYKCFFLFKLIGIIRVSMNICGKGSLDYLLKCMSLSW